MTELPPGPTPGEPEPEPAPGAGPLPRDFRLLWAAYGTSNLADGVLLAAGPLLVTSLTRDPFLVSLAVTVQLAPTFVLSLPVGAIVDRADRRRMQAVAHGLRAIVLGVVAWAVVADALTLPLLYGALTVLGSAEVFGDTAGGTLVPATVRPAQIGTATSRLVGTHTITNRLAGPPLGALLIGIGLAVPYVVNALLLAAAAVLVSRISVDGRPATGPPRVAGDEPEVRWATRLRRDIAEGWRFTLETPPLRRLALLIVVFNLTFGATYGIQVLWALERLGLDEVGFGTLLTASAVGGFVGAALFPRLERRFGYATLLRTGLVVESATHFLLASSTSAYAAGAVLLFFGVHEAVWGSLSSTIRLRVTPERVLGRVVSVYRLAIIAPLVVGSALGGVLADRFGILAPFWYAGIGATITTALVWRSMDDLGSAAEHVTDDSPPG